MTSFRRRLSQFGILRAESSQWRAADGRHYSETREAPPKEPSGVPALADDFSQSDDLADAAGLLWEQAKAQLAGQKAEVDALRTRAVALLSVASLVAGLFGSRLPHNHAPTRTVVASLVALALFGVSVVLALLIAAPKRRWVFTFTLSELVRRVDQGIARPVDVTSNLTSWGGCPSAERKQTA